MRLPAGDGAELPHHPHPLQASNRDADLPACFQAGSSSSESPHQLRLALVLTIPIYLGLANSPLDDWFQSGAGWHAFEPLFDAMARLGIHGEGGILIGAMLIASLAIAAMLVRLASFRRRNRR